MKHKLHALLILAPLLTLASCNGFLDQSNPIGENGDYAPEGYSLAWSDEFDGDFLNDAYWSHERGNNHGWGNGESQYYTGHNDRVEGGNLIITAKRENYEGYDFTSTRIRTKGKVTTTYGYVCARIKLPAVEGMWPAFWMMPEEGWWPNGGEIDIMENKGREKENTSSACHFTKNYQHSQFNHNVHSGNIEDYHVYAVEWTNTSITFYVDGKAHLTRDMDAWNADYNGTNAPFDKNFHIILNMAVGGVFDDYTMPPEDWESSEMLVDYVRIYHQDN